MPREPVIWMSTHMVMLCQWADCQYKKFGRDSRSSGHEYPAVKLRFHGTEMLCLQIQSEIRIYDPRKFSHNLLFGLIFSAPSCLRNDFPIGSNSESLPILGESNSNFGAKRFSTDCWCSVSTATALHATNQGVRQ